MYYRSGRHSGQMASAVGGRDIFLTGTDEHGQKVAESAEKEELGVREYCDKVAPVLKRLGLI